MIAFHDGPAKIFRWEVGGSARSAPRSGPFRRRPEPFGPAATLFGPNAFGLPACRSGPARAAWGCREQELGWAADLRRVRPAGGRGEVGLEPAEPGLRAAGVPPPERSARGGGRPVAPRITWRGSTGHHPTNSWNRCAGEAPLPEPSRTQARVRWAYFTNSFFVPIPGKTTTTFVSSPLPIRSRILPTPHSGCLTLIPGW